MEPDPRGFYVSRGTAILATALIIAVISIAVLVTLLMARDEGASKSVTTADTAPATATPLGSFQTASPTASTVVATPTPTPQSPTTQPPTATATPAPTQPAIPTPTAAPTPVPATPTASQRYASVEARPYYDAYITARNALDAINVTTYEAALASPNFAVLARATANTLYALSSFTGNLPYDDSCRRALTGLGGRGGIYWNGLANAVSPDPFGLAKIGPATWNQTIGAWQAQYIQLGTEVAATCGY